MKILGKLIFTFIILSQSFSAQAIYYQPSNSNFYQRHKHFIKKPTTSVPNKTRIRLTRNLPCIDSIHIKGGVNLQIIGGQTTNKIKLKRVYPELAIDVYNHTIYINNPKSVDCNQNPRPCIKLYISQLQELMVSGSGSCIRGCNLTSCCGLTINHCGNGSVYLEGPVRLMKIVNTGGASICARCVRTDHLDISDACSGYVKLLGSTDLLLIRAFQHAYIDTHFLCSNCALVQADNFAVVAVRTICDLRAFASGMSNIYYYVTPRSFVKHNALSGNVFPMGNG